MRRKHIPVRTCAGCGAHESKRALIRVVRTPTGAVEIDTTGKKAGRGTYLCARLSCWEAGVRRERLDHVLHTTIPQEARLALLAYARQQYDVASALGGGVQIP